MHRSSRQILQAAVILDQLFSCKSIGNDEMQPLAIWYQASMRLGTRIEQDLASTASRVTGGS